jgi:hypothetical protein
MGDERIRPVPKEVVEKLRRNGKKYKWVEPAREIKQRLESGEEIVGYYIGLPEKSDRSAEVNSVQSCLYERLKAAFHQERVVYSKARYIPEESDLTQGWWIFLSLEPIK